MNLSNDESCQKCFTLFNKHQEQLKQCHDQPEASQAAHNESIYLMNFQQKIL